MGVIGTNQTGAKSRGLHLHLIFAVATSGLPLGVLRGQCEAPKSKPEDDKRPSHAIPLEEKETYCLRHSREMTRVCSPRVTH